jgi:hypothetical protein
MAPEFSCSFVTRLFSNSLVIVRRKRATNQSADNSVFTAE